MKQPVVHRPSTADNPWSVRFPSAFGAITVVLCALAVACSTVLLGPAAGTYVCGLVIIVLALVMSLARPQYLLALAIAISSTAGAFRSVGSVEVAGAIISVSGGLTAVLLVGAVVALLANPGVLRREWLADIAPYLGLALLQVVRTPGSSLPIEGLRDATLMSGPLLYYFLTRLVLRQRITSADRIETLLLYSILIPLAVLALSAPTGGIEYDETGFRGLIGRRALALYLLVILSLGLAVWRFATTGKERGLGRLLSLLSVGVIIVSLSRMASAVALGVLMPLRLLSPGRRTAIKIGLLGILGVTFMVLLLQWPPMRQRFFGTGEVSLLRLDEAAEQMNPYGRDLVWSLTWTSALERPLIGHGTGASRQLVESWYPGLEHPHNEFLRLFHDLGLPGLLLLLWAWFGRLIRHLRRWAWSERAGLPSCARAQMAAALAVLAVTLSMVTDNPLACVFILIPVFMLMGMADEAWSEVSSLHLEGASGDDRIG